MHSKTTGIYKATTSALRLSRLHPYPAMVADGVAITLARQFIPPMARVIDPFCGSGRLLTAAEGAAVRVGLDVNPLACLLSQAKLTPVHTDVIELVYEKVISGKAYKLTMDPSKIAHFEQDTRKVQWFTPEILYELDRLVYFLNDFKLQGGELFLIAAALSAVVREVSFARQGGWKLHRLDELSRSCFLRCPWNRFECQLSYCIRELKTTDVPSGRSHIFQMDACSLRNANNDVSQIGPFDVVLTSPPYGELPNHCPVWSCLGLMSFHRI